MTSDSLDQEKPGGNSGKFGTPLQFPFEHNSRLKEAGKPELINTLSSKRGKRWWISSMSSQ